jgi:hypothetical protein
MLLGVYPSDSTLANVKRCAFKDIHCIIFNMDMLEVTSQMQSPVPVVLATSEVQDFEASLGKIVIL